ncbi:hypothetical protein ACVXG7_17120 [Enterobacter hormaechei]
MPTAYRQHGFIAAGEYRAETDSRGQLKVNSMYQTALPHVYAVAT